MKKKAKEGDRPKTATRNHIGERDQHQIKTNCLVVMVVKEENGIWTITSLQLDHNHDLNPVNRNQLFSGKKYITDVERL
ncbi:protein FAR1-RELATED SEQUENCE 5-like [Panicum miliaceum]|uniref:Protein FAR1-RELATED SEQUENCE 5-like n=1 Tax=Panicum miliaceum TaxID=4540 RepID=A0A3L6PBP1_PANMI|nr:protein FAR1-RELATED SEQUENCE 5-like [Panicum miliaceum]